MLFGFGGQSRVMSLIPMAVTSVGSVTVVFIGLVAVTSTGSVAGK